MAISPVGLSLGDWDATGALDALLAEETTELGLGEASVSETVPEGGRSPLYSPFSDVGSTQSGDSGFSPALVGEDDQLLLAGLFGGDFTDLLDCDPSSSSSTSLSLSAPAPLAGPDNTNGASTYKIDSVSSSTNRQNSMFGSDFDLDSPSPPPPPSVTSKNTTNLTAREKSRKNAEAARQNRLKKKQYMEDLEKDRSRARAENVVLKTRCTELHTKNRKLETEVAYLRSVLANQSTLATLIKNIPGAPGVNLTSSFSRKRPGDSANSVNPSSVTPPSSKRAKCGDDLRHSGGVCLHVAKDRVSLEFCAQCSLKSTQV